MKRGMFWLAACGLAVVLIGCQKAADAPKEKPATESTEPGEDAQSSVGKETSSEFTLVKLNVPNMT